MPAPASLAGTRTLMSPPFRALAPLCGALLCFFTAAAPAAVQINEFMVDNPGRPNDPNAQLDMDGNSPGWIELHNNGAAAVQLTGWALSDDPADPGKWVFAAPVAPATVHTTIPANGYRLVYCGGVERNVANVEAHTTFSLDDGGVVLLSQPDGTGGWTVVSQIGTAAVPYPNQRKAVSYGYPSNNSTLPPVFFESDTPGTANGSAVAGVMDFCADTQFDVDRGFYDTPFTLTLTCATPGATIAWTVNGNVPTSTHGTQVPAADAASTPVATINITGTTIIRARAWKAGFGSSNVDTHTYIFASQVLTQTGPLPSMNLTANDTHPWGTTGGTPRTPAGPDWAVETGATQYPNVTNRFTAEDLKKLPVVSLVTAWREAFGPNSAAPDYAATPVDKRGFYVGSEISVPQEGTDRYCSLEYLNPAKDSANPNAVKGFQSDGNVHIFGGTSQQRWKSYKLSMRFKAQENINFPLYGDDASPSQDTLILDARLNQVWVHATDSTQRQRGDYVRDHVMSDLQNSMGGLSNHSQPVHYFINGLYWGLYILHEKPNGKFMGDYRGGDKYDWDVFKHSAAAGVDGNNIYGLTISAVPLDPAFPLGSTANATISPYYNCSTLKNYEDMLDLLGLGRVAPNPVPVMSTQAALEAAAEKIDIPEFMDYMLLNCVAANTDWPHKNYYASYDRTAVNPRWRWHSWDAEHVFRSESENTFTQGNWNGDSDTGSRGPGAIMRRLAQHPEFRLWFADRAHLRLFNNGELSTAKLQAAFNRRFAEIDPWGIRGESARWGDNRSPAGQPYSYTTNAPFTTPTWMNERNRILNTILPARGSLTATSNSALANLRAFAGGALYPATVAPQFRNNTTDALQHGGIVPSSFTLKIFNGNTGGAGTIYYTLDGTDPRTAWTGAVNANALTYSAPFALGSSKSVKSRILNAGVWSALNEAYFSVGTLPASAANLVVSELHYNPAAPSAAEIAAGHDQRRNFEYIELMNIGTTGVNLEGVRFGAGFDYTFTAASAVRELAPGERVLLVDRLEAFAMRYGPGKPVAGTFQLGTNLSDSGERIEILAADGSVIKDFTYNDKSPWPVAADGAGWSLVLIKPQTNPDPSQAHHWRPSALSGGNPGAADVLSYATWKAAQSFTDDWADDDQDGTANCEEYFFKTDPASATSRPVVSGAVQTHLADPGPGLPPVPGEYLTLTFTRNPAADEATCIPEVSDNLGVWSDDSAGLLRVSITPNPDGTVTEVWRSTVPASTGRRRFGRVRVTVP